MNLPISDILAAATAIATVIFVCLLYLQLRNQNTERSLTIRPIISLDKNYAGDPAIKFNKDMPPHIQLRLINLGSIPTGNMQIMLLPLDDHYNFVKREKALKKYIKNIKKDLMSNDSCLVLNPIRERMKSSRRIATFNKYIVIGDDLKNLKPIISEYESILNNMKDKKKEIIETGKARAMSLAKLDPDDWEAFYHAGIKRGDLLDIMGPIDWENFDSNGGITREDIKAILREDATKIYETIDQRKKILNAMSQEDRERFNIAIKKRQNLWKSFPVETAKQITILDMKLRKAYKNAKDINVRKISMSAPQHPIYLSMDLSESDVQKINEGNYVYFGVLVQYSKPNDKKYQYVYYLQGYYHQQTGNVDYTLDFLDV